MSLCQSGSLSLDSNIHENSKKEGRRKFVIVLKCLYFMF